MTSNSANIQSSATSITVLELLGETSKVHRRDGTQPLLSRELSLGVDSLVRQSIWHAPPMPIELEQAIELTEDVVMPLAAQFAGGTHLVLRGFGAELIARVLDAAGMAKASLTLEEIETLFNRLVAVSEGRPASQEVLPTDGRFVAAMLMLREFMHHLSFAKVTLQTSNDPG